MAEPLIGGIDCVSFPVRDLDEALRFYREGLGHELVWRTPSAAGLRLPHSEAELVLHTENRPPEVDLKVESVPQAVHRFVAAGGRVVAAPFDITIGKCAVVADPFGNQLFLLDASKGHLATDDRGNVTGLR